MLNWFWIRFLKIFFNHAVQSLSPCASRTGLISVLSAGRRRCCSPSMRSTKGRTCCPTLTSDMSSTTHASPSPKLWKELWPTWRVRTRLCPTTAVGTGLRSPPWWEQGDVTSPSLRLESSAFTTSHRWSVWCLWVEFGFCLKLSMCTQP